MISDYKKTQHITFSMIPKFPDFSIDLIISAALFDTEYEAANIRITKGIFSVSEDMFKSTDYFIS